MGKKMISLEIKFFLPVALATLLGFGIMAYLTIQWMASGYEKHYENKANIARAYIVDKIEDKMLSKTAETIPLILNDIDKIRKLEGVAELRFFNADGEETFTNEQGPADPEVMDVLRTGKPVSFRKEVRDYRVFSSIIPVENKRECRGCHSGDEKLGVILLSMSMKGMVKEITGQTKRYAWVFSIIALILGLITLFVVKKLFLEPLSLIYEGTQEIKRGRLDFQVPVKSHDEIGILAESFNTMASSLKASMERLTQHTAELAVLNEISSAATQSIDLDKVLRDILSHLSKLGALRIDKQAIIFLADEESKRLELAAYHGVSRDFIKNDKTVDYGDCLCGISAETRTIITTADCHNDERYTRVCGALDTHGHIILPLEVKKKLVGVLCLFTPSMQKLSDREVNLYKTIADIVSVAIENARIHKTTVEMARTDGLTGLYNHNEFQHVLEHEVLRGRRYKKEFSLLMLDIDHFKKFNDTYGHQAGDNILRTIGQKIKREVRGMDIPARYGGEEFVIILPETSAQYGMHVAERLCTSMSGHEFKIDDKRVQITVSIGVAGFPQHAETAEHIVKNADKALYLAKNTGRNRACLFETTTEQNG